MYILVGYGAVYNVKSRSEARRDFDSSPSRPTPQLPEVGLRVREGNVIGMCDSPAAAARPVTQPGLTKVASSG